MSQESNIDLLIKARADIDEKLRQHKSSLSILFTDVVGSTSYFDRYGDTAGLLMLHRHADLASNTIAEFQGLVIKTIGDSVMAEFPEPALAVRAAVEIQLRLFQINRTIARREQLQLRIGINSGIAFRHGNDVYGDAVNVAARITKRTGPAQILISRSTRDRILDDKDLSCRWLGKVTMEGKAAAEDVFEVIWTDTATYSGLREDVTAAVTRGELTVPGLKVEDLLQPGRKSTPLPPDEQSTLPGLTPPPQVSSERYELLDKVGSGGMGVVYKARDNDTGTTIAIKVLHSEITGRSELIERFKTELVLARKITHKNVCRVYDFSRLGNSAAISMEYIDGESLRSLLSRVQGLSIRHGMTIARQVIAGLAEAHAEGVVHRDLKPENILIARDGTVKVMDFGIARSIDTGATATGTILGTPAYMSPEQAEGKQVDARADIYALGLILYEMFTGIAAFTGDTPLALALKQVKETAPPPRELEPSIPEYIENAILKCVEKNPSRRFQSVQELESALQYRPSVAAAPAPVTVSAPEVVDPVVPEHLASWQKSDWTLLGAACFSTIVFVLLFLRFHPATDLQVTIDSQGHKTIMAGVLKRLGMSGQIVDAPLRSSFLQSYFFYRVAAAQGMGAGLDYLKESTSGSWAGTFYTANQTGRYEIDSRGKIDFVDLPATFEDPQTHQTVSQILARAEQDPDGTIAQSKEMARRVLVILYGEDLAGMEPSLTRQGPASQGWRFTWNFPEKVHGWNRIMAADVSRMGLRLSQYLDVGVRTLDSGSFEPPFRSMISIVIAYLCLFLFFKKKIYRQPRSPGNLSVAVLSGLCVSLLGVASGSSADERIPWFVTPLILFCISTLFIYALLATVVYYMRSRCPAQVANYLLLFRKGLRARSAGLELIRGIFAGIIFTGAWMTLLSVLGIWGLGLIGTPYLRDFNFGSRSLNLSLALPPVSWAETTAIAWLLIAFPVSLMSKTTVRPVLILAALSTLWLALGVSSAGAMVFPQLPYHVIVALEAVFFGAVFLRYGLLATMSAALTIETGLLSLPFWIIFKRIYPFTQSLPLAAWFVLAALAVVIYGYSEIGKLYHRLVQVFE